MTSLSIKCKNTKCKEVFHRYDIIFPLCNDYGYIDIKCNSCGTVTRVPVYNPVPYGFGGNYEIIGAAEINTNDEWQALNEIAGKYITRVDGYETVNSPIHKWRANDTPFWSDGINNFEVIDEGQINQVRSEVLNHIASYNNARLAGQFFAPDIQKIFVFQEYTLNNITQSCIWAKDILRDADYNTDDLYLIHHSNCKNLVDGVFPRDTLLIFLERLLVRWKMICNHVIIASPFIGYDLKYSKPDDLDEISYLWRYINGLQDVTKTTFLTRPSSYTSLKKNQKDTKELKEWDLLPDLQKKYHDKKTRDEAIDKFHFKLYAGIMGNKVEVFDGSYNIQTGKTLENMTLRAMEYQYFKTRYLDNMVNGFCVKEYSDDKTLCIYVDINGKVDQKVLSLSDVAKQISNLF